MTTSYVFRKTEPVSTGTYSSEEQDSELIVGLDNDGFLRIAVNSANNTIKLNATDATILRDMITDLLEMEALDNE